MWLVIMKNSNKNSVKLNFTSFFFQAPDKLRSNELSDGQEIGTLADNSLTIMDTKDGLTIASKIS